MQYRGTCRVPEHLRDAGVEFPSRPLDSVECPPAGTDACEAEFRRQIENQGQVGRQAAGGGQIRGLEQLAGDTPTTALVCLGGELKPIGEDRPPGLQRGTDHPSHEIRPGSEEQEELADWFNAVGRIQQQQSDPLSDGGPAGFPNQDRFASGGGEVVSQGPDQGALPCPFGSFHDEKVAAFHPSVMMLLAAPLSIPWAINWFTLTMVFSKFARPTA